MEAKSLKKTTPPINVSPVWLISFSKHSPAKIV